MYWNMQLESMGQSSSLYKQGVNKKQNNLACLDLIKNQVDMRFLFLLLATKNEYENRSENK